MDAKFGALDNVCLKRDVRVFVCHEVGAPAAAPGAPKLGQ